MPRNNRVFVNEDDSHFFIGRGQLGIAPTRDDIERFADQYADTGVTDFVLCCAGRMVDFPSKTRESMLEKYAQREENGLAVDYSGHPWPKCLRDIYEVNGLDFYAVCVERFRALGIRPHLSVRMNDCHDNNLPASVLHPAAYHARPDLRRVTHREALSYFDRCIDYGKKEVRDGMLAFLAEVLDRYDADGLELDWQRERFCFKPGGEWEGARLLTEFTRAARALTEAAGKRRGHKIALMARVPADPRMALEAGFDVSEWARQGLVDVVVPSPRWETSDSDIPVELWKRLLAGTGVEVAACLEILLRPSPREGLLYACPAAARALAHQHLTTGADAVYLFNYMDNPSGAPSPRLEAEDDVLLPENYLAFLRVLGDPRALARSERRHIQAYCDSGPMWRSREKEAPLPLHIGAGRLGALRLRLGDVPADAELTLVLGLEGGEPPRAYVNSAPATLIGRAELKPAYARGEFYEYRLENAAPFAPFAVVEAVAGEATTLTYAEVRVICK